MGLRPHDLLCIPNAASLLDFETLPAWARVSLQVCPVVVVRRVSAPDGLVPIGIRGIERGQRAAAYLRCSAVEACISPEDLADQKPWLKAGSRTPWRAALPQFEALRQVSEAAEREAFVWGPTGSTGFELATGTHVIRAESDLDIVVRFSSGMSTPALRSFRAVLSNAPVHVDILLERDGRAAVLDEYLESPRLVLVKTSNGPELGAFEA